MRTIEEIKNTITEDFMKNESVAAMYGFTPGDNFITHFSKVSVESILFYVFACAVWLVENIFEQHKKEVSERIEQFIPHRPKWYRDKTLNFMKDKILIPDTDKYNIEDLSDSDILNARVIKHAVATENKDASILTIKVAGENGGKRCKLDAATELQLAAYIAEIKDAGVRINLVNIDADIFNCNIDIYYNPMLLLDLVEENCRKTIKIFIENLPFNGEYTNMGLVDVLQKIEGVKIVELKSATTSATGVSTLIPIDARNTPNAGYFTVGTITLKMLVYNELL